MIYAKKYGLLLIVGCLLLVNIFIWQAVLASGDNENNLLKIFYLDIGQGDATLIEAPNGNQVLIDGGRTDNKVLYELGEVMPITDRTLDVVIATHPDADHVGGLPQVLERFEVGMYVESGNETKDTQIVKALEQTLSENKLDRVLGKRGQRIILDEEKQIYLDILYPDRDVSRVESNDASIIAKLTYGKTCFIFSGDADSKIENYILNIEKNNLDCEVLKAGHHGSRTSTSGTWIGFISPDYAVISLGKNNSYGHPHKETLATLEKFGAKTLRTDTEGRIEINSDGQNVFVD